MKLRDKQRYYEALLAKDSQYDGLFFVGVKTTGVFCHASCPARKPKFANCDFFESAKTALLAGFRPCKRCQPLSSPKQFPPLIKKLIQCVEDNPEKRWRDADFRAAGLDESTARRQFKKHFGMTFIEYARSRRLGLGLQSIRSGEKVIDAQLQAGFESASGFFDAFSQIMGTPPSQATGEHLTANWLETPLGPMLAIANATALLVLEFVDRRALENEIKRLRLKLKLPIIPGTNKVITHIKRELSDYFSGKCLTFNTPLAMLGTPYQQTVWQALQTIPIGQTISYAALAKMIGKPTAYRAVANANGANQMAIIIPCHRVIAHDGGIGGYGGGISRKQWLLNHENKHQA